MQLWGRYFCSFVKLILFVETNIVVFTLLSLKLSGEETGGFKYGNAANSLFKFGVPSETVSKPSETVSQASSAPASISSSTSTSNPLTSTTVSSAATAKFQFGASISSTKETEVDKKVDNTKTDVTESKANPVVSSNGGFKFGAASSTTTTPASSGDYVCWLINDNNASLNQI